MADFEKFYLFVYFETFLLLVKVVTFGTMFNSFRSIPPIQWQWRDKK